MDSADTRDDDCGPVIAGGVGSSSKPNNLVDVVPLRDLLVAEDALAVGRPRGVGLVERLHGDLHVLADPAAGAGQSVAPAASGRGAEVARGQRDNVAGSPFAFRGGLHAGWVRWVNPGGRRSGLQYRHMPLDELGPDFDLVTQCPWNRRLAEFGVGTDRTPYGDWRVPLAAVAGAGAVASAAQGACRAGSAFGAGMTCARRWGSAANVGFRMSAGCGCKPGEPARGETGREARCSPAPATAAPVPRAAAD